MKNLILVYTFLLVPTQIIFGQNKKDPDVKGYWLLDEITFYENTTKASSPVMFLSPAGDWGTIDFESNEMTVSGKWFLTDKVLTLKESDTVYTQYLLIEENNIQLLLKQFDLLHNGAVLKFKRNL